MNCMTYYISNTFLTILIINNILVSVNRSNFSEDLFNTNYYANNGAEKKGAGLSAYI